MKRLRAFWQPSVVALSCGWCFAEMDSLSLGEVAHVGHANLKCKSCGGINVLSGDLLKHTQNVEARIDPDNPPGRAAAWDSIVGNPVLKRALEIALVGHHTLTYVGDPNVAWNEAAVILGPRANIMQRCSCGNFMNTYEGAATFEKTCFCTLTEIKAHRTTRKFAEAYLADIIVEAVPASAEEVFSNREPYMTVLERIKRVRFNQQFYRAKMDVRVKDNPTFELLNDMRKKWDFTSHILVSVQRVAMTLAEMEERDVVTPMNMAEAMAYRTPLLLQQ